jgi:superfamily II DNA helicase RecQ
LNDDSNTNFDKKLLSHKLNKAQSLLLDFFISLLQQNIEFNKFDSCINSFFACYSVNVRTQSLKDSAQMSQYYSAFIYCAQLLTLEHCTQQYLQKKVEQTDCSLLTELSFFMNTFFHNTTVTALAEILSLRAYAFKVNKNSSFAFNQIIVHNDKLISCKDITVSLFNMKHLFKQLTLKTHDILFSELLLNADVSDFSDLTLSALAATENLADNTAHAYFLSHNTTLSHFSSYLQKKVLANKTLREQMFFMKRNRLMFKTKSISNYIESLKRLLLHLQLLMDFTASVSARATELSTLTYCNSITSAQRTLLFDKSACLFMLRLRYTKNFQTTEQEASAVKYLCAAVSHITALYIVLVLPFKHFIEIECFNRTIAHLSLLFEHEDTVFNTRQLSLLMRSCSLQYIKQRLTVSKYRHLILAFVKYSMCEELFFDEENNQDKSSSHMSDADIAAASMHHSRKTAEFTYARQTNTIRNVRTDKQRQFLSFSLRYYNFFDLHKISLSSFSNNTHATSFSLRQSHKHALSISHYEEQTQSRKSVRLSDLQHTLSSDNNVSFDYLLALLKEFLQDDSAMFKSEEQKEALKQMLKKTSCLTVILATSSGKSFLYLLLASISTAKTMIIIVPLIALKSDLLRKAKEMKISASIYKEKKSADKLVLVSIETAVSSSFQLSLMSLHAEIKLDRIIFNECHLIVTAANYRYKMHELKKLRLITTQFVFLSATLSVSVLQEMNKMLFLSNNVVIRASTVRHNISYSVKRMTLSTLEEQFSEVLDFLLEEKNQYTKDDRVLIYVMNIALANRLSKYLSYQVLHRDVEDKESVLTKFRSQNISVLVCTFVLSAGFDYSSVRTVIHFQSAYSIIDFVQESGRAGRDNRLAKSIVFISSSSSLSTQRDSEEQKAFKLTYSAEKVCRRRVLNAELDDQHMTECQQDSQALCDLCQTREVERSTIRENVLTSQQTVEFERLNFFEILDQFKNVCTFCFVMSFDLEY